MGSETLYCDNFTLVNKEKNKVEYRNQFDNYDIKVKINGKTKSFTINEETWNVLKEGEKLEICWIKGALGYDVIYSFDEQSKEWE